MNLEWVAGRRLLALAVTALLVVLFALLRGFGGGWVARIGVLVPLLIGVGITMASLLAVRSWHPRLLVARPEVPAFDTPPNPTLVLTAAGMSFLVSGYLTTELATEILMILLAGVLGLLWVAALGPFGLRLRPDGILDRQLFGALFVPWEALAAGHPAAARTAQAIALDLANPHLVRRSGLRPGDRSVLSANGVDADLLVRAITDYVARPELRAEIGSAAELARLAEA